MSAMHGKVIGQKPLFVAVAERKEERKARLQVMLVFYLVYISFKLTLELNYG
jgi:predicted nucleic acid-binding Zn ribbon protein